MGSWLWDAGSTGRVRRPFKGCHAASTVFETAEHAFDGAAALVKRLAEAAFPALVGLGRDVGDRALLFDEVADAVAVIGPVGVDDAAHRQAHQQRLTGLAVGRRSRRHQEGERSFLAVDDGVDLGVAPAPADADRAVSLVMDPSPRCAARPLSSSRH